MQDKAVLPERIPSARIKCAHFVGGLNSDLSSRPLLWSFLCLHLPVALLAGIRPLSLCVLSLLCLTAFRRWSNAFLLPPASIVAIPINHSMDVEGKSGMGKEAGHKEDCIHKSFSVGIAVRYQGMRRRKRDVCVKE